MQNSTKINPLHDLACSIIEPDRTADACIIWLHGLGASGDDLKPLIACLSLPEFSIRHVFPHAVARPITWNQGAVMRAWYDISGNDLMAREDEVGIKQSQQAIVQLLDAQLKRGIAAERIMLAGFSQGGAMALYTALNYGQKLGGIIALSGFLPLVKQQYYANTSHTATPIFMAAGSLDQLVPMKWSLLSKQCLTQHGFNRISWHTYPVEHCICPQEIADMGLWIRQVWRIE